MKNKFCQDKSTSQGSGVKEELTSPIISPWIYFFWFNSSGDKYGRWYGRGVGNTRDNYFMFEENKKFNLSGEYSFKLEHGMRQNPLKGVNKIGFKIEKND